MGHKQRMAATATIAVAVLLALAPSALAKHLYVANSNSGSISPFSIGASGALTPTGCAACSTGAESAPQGVAISPNGRFLYVADEGTNAVSPFTVGSSGSLTSITCTVGCATGSEPYWLAATPNGRFLYVTNYDGDTVSPYSIGSQGALTPITCTGTGGVNCETGEGPEEPAISPNGKYLYVENSESETVSAFSIGSNGSLARITCGDCTTGSYPWVSAFTPNGKYLYVLNDGSGSISPFAVGSNGSLNPIACSSPHCNAGTPGDGFGSAGPYSLAMSPDGRFLYAVNYSDDAVYPYSITSSGSLTPIACTPSSNCSTGAGSDPTAAAMSPDGRFLYVTDYGTSQLSVFAVAASGTLSPVSCSSSDCGPVDDTENTYGQSVVVAPDQAPTASFTATAASAGQPSTFNGSASTASAGQTVATYLWSFGDGTHTTSTTATVKHTYAKAGTYKATLTVTDNAGCSTELIFTGQTAYCNGSDAARTTRTVTVKGITVTTQKATNVKTTSAKLHGAITALSQKVQWRFQYGLTSSYGHSTPLKTIAAGHSKAVPLSFLLTGLKSGKTYHFRLEGTAAGSSTVYGRDLTFKTT